MAGGGDEGGEGEGGGGEVNWGENKETRRNYCEFGVRNSEFGGKTDLSTDKHRF
jgi:hypothetical protein